MLTGSTSTEGVSTCADILSERGRSSDGGRNGADVWFGESDLRADCWFGESDLSPQQ